MSEDPMPSELDASGRELSESRFRRLVASVPDHGILMLDSQGVVQTWNHAAAEISGYASTEAVGKPYFQVFQTAEMLSSGQSEVELKTATEHGQFSGEGWRIRKDGTRYWATLTLSAMRGDHGELDAYALVVRDLTARREAEERLRRSEEQFRLLVESVKDYAIFMLDPKGYIQTWNVGAERIKGYRADEIVGKHFSIFYTKEDQSDGKPARELEIAERDGRVHDEGIRLRKDGTCFWADVVITALFDKTGKLYGFTKVTRDATDRKLLADQQATLIREQARREEAERNNQMKDEFLMVLSHELRTPLTPILGWTKMLQNMHPREETVNRALDVIERNVKLQTRIVEDLLDISRIVSGRITLERRPVGLAQLIDETLATVRPFMEQKKIQFKFTIESSVGPLMADPGRIRQVLWNILNNAVKFTAEGGLIEIILRKRNALAEITIRDNGLGIDPKYLPKLFSRFSQADTSTTRTHGGLGLGLSIAKSLVELHHGTITAASEGLGKGATITITLPVAESVAGTNLRYPFASPEDSAHALLGLRVLIVDDEFDTLELLEYVLGKSGAEVQAALSAVDALQKLDDFQPDIVISDIGMPEHDGFWLVREIQKRRPGIPVVAVTAFARAEDRTRALSGGFCNHVSKPIEPQELINVITETVKPAS